MLKRLANLTQREIGFLVVLAAVAIIFVPVLQTRGLPEERRFELEDKARSTLTQIIAASSVGLYFTLRNLRATEKNVDLAERKLHGERFLEGTKMMSSEWVFSQIGGIHALRELAMSAEGYYWLCVDTLATYIRHRCGTSVLEVRVSGANDIVKEFYNPHALEVLVAIETLFALRSKILLSELGVNNKGNGIALSLTNWKVCQFYNVNFEDADFSFAILNYAQIYDSDFRRARLNNSNLRVADIKDSDFREANFFGADLSGATLRKVKVHGANFTGAKLYGAHLGAVEGLTREQLLLAEGDCRTILPSDIPLPEQWIKGQVAETETHSPLNPAYETPHSPT